MTSNQKGLLAVGITLGVAGLAYYFLVHKKDYTGTGGDSGSPNLESAKTNLGGKFAKDHATVKFNEQKHKATFYNNNRVVIVDDKGVITKGGYLDGGKVITMDNGKKAESNSVWNNLMTVIK